MNVLVLAENDAAARDLCAGAYTLADEVSLVVFDPDSPLRCANKVFCIDVPEDRTVDDAYLTVKGIVVEEEPAIVLVEPTRSLKVVAGRLADRGLRTRGWTSVSPQNQHLDVYGVLYAPELYRLGTYTNDENLQSLARVMYRSCGQLIDPWGRQGEQIQQTNFAQRGDLSDVTQFRGGYAEGWTVFWITAHFLHAAAKFDEMGVRP